MVTFWQLRPDFVVVSPAAILIGKDISTAEMGILFVDIFRVILNQTFSQGVCKWNKVCVMDELAQVL